MFRCKPKNAIVNNDQQRFIAVKTFTQPHPRIYTGAQKVISKLAKLHLQRRPETNKHIRYTVIITSTHSQKHLVIHITEQTDFSFLTFSKHLPQTGTGHTIGQNPMCGFREEFG